MLTPSLSEVYRELMRKKFFLRLLLDTFREARKTRSDGSWLCPCESASHCPAVYQLSTFLVLSPAVQPAFSPTLLSISMAKKYEFPEFFSIHL